MKCLTTCNERQRRQFLASKADIYSDTMALAVCAKLRVYPAVLCAEVGVSWTMMPMTLFPKDVYGQSVVVERNPQGPGSPRVS